MPDLPKPNSLSSGDALFLYFERQGQPVNVASVNVFEGVIPLDVCIRFIESRLPLIPRYLQRVVTAPYNIDLPSWEYDPNFDIRNHVREITLARGTDAEFKEVAGKILSTSLDRKRPLWDFTLLHGLKGNRTGAILRMHHCLADGIAGVGLMNALMDTSPTPPSAKPREHLPPPPQASQKSLLDDLIISSMTTIKRFLAAESELLTLAKQAIAGAEKRAGAGEATGESGKPDVPFSLVDEVVRVLPELGTPPERLPFNVVCRGPQKFNWAEISLAEIKAVKDACGVTVNDVVLAIVTSTVRRYAELHGVRVEGRRLRIVVPVNVRGDTKTSEFGNRITFFPVDLPLDIEEPRQLIDAVRAAVARVRNAHLPELVSLLGTWISAIPTALQAIVGPLTSQLPLSLCNLICTNVPGPQVPLYFFGHRMLSCYPYVPIGGEMGMNCAILSYDGTAYFGFTGDAHAIADLKVLDGILATSFAELRKAAGVRPARRQRSRRKTKATRAKAAAKSGKTDASSATSVDPPKTEARPLSGATVSPAEEAAPPNPIVIPERPTEEPEVVVEKKKVASAAAGA
jgi:diacylglycerol O-acyltransferase